ncbi:hypothetical protein CKF46_31615, partial [Klebsiella pneumoniae]
VLIDFFTFFLRLSGSSRKLPAVNEKNRLGGGFSKGSVELALYERGNWLKGSAVTKTVRLV